MKDVCKAALCAAYKYPGIARFQEILTTKRRASSVSVLLFHRVTDAIPEDGLTVGTRRFRHICRMLQRRFHVLSIAEVFRRRQAGEAFPPRSVAITFDDCYRDNLFAAYMLSQHGLPACFFVPTAFVGTDHVFEWDRALKRMPNLTWDDVRKMAHMGFEIGSHTMHHPNMALLSNAEALQELTGSRAVLEEQLGRWVRWFAFPFGGPQHHRPDQEKLIAEAGYEGAFLAHGGPVAAGTTGMMLPREPVPCFHSVLNLELHLTGTLDWLYALKRRLGMGRHSDHVVFDGERDRGDWALENRLVEVNV